MKVDRLRTPFVNLVENTCHIFESKAGLINTRLIIDLSFPKPGFWPKTGRRLLPSIVVSLDENPGFQLDGQIECGLYETRIGRTHKKPRNETRPKKHGWTTGANTSCVGLLLGNWPAYVLRVLELCEGEASRGVRRRPLCRPASEGAPLSIPVFHYLFINCSSPSGCLGPL